MAKYSKCEFSVTGSLSFPWDMLRYDAAYPASEQDSALIEAACRHDKGPFTVRLVSQAENTVRRGPTDGRWRSFGWHVVPGSWERRA